MFPYPVRRSFIGAIGSAGLYRIAGLFCKKHPRILMYHRFSETAEPGKVSAKAFEWQIQEIRKCYKIYPLSAIVECLRSGNPVPSDAIVLTVDDGYEDFYRVAWPILKALEAPATVYITTRFIDGDLWLWPDKLSYILDNANAKSMRLVFDGNESVYDLDNSDSITVVWTALINRMLRMRPNDRDKLLFDIADELSVNTPSAPIRKYAPMTWENIRELSSSGIAIGAHTRTHPVLSTLTREQAADEIAGSKTDIEKITGEVVHDFCYPNGAHKDYTKETSAIVKDSGYNNAVVSYHDNRSITDVYALRRYGVSEGFYSFRKVIHGLLHMSDLLGAVGNPNQ